MNRRVSKRIASTASMMARAVDKPTRARAIARRMRRAYSRGNLDAAGLIQLGVIASEKVSAMLMKDASG